MRMRISASLAALFFAVGCNTTRVERTETPRPASELNGNDDALSASERNLYESTLMKASGDYAEDVRAWHEAARRSLRERLDVPAAFREVVRFNGQDAYAVGYRIDLRRGQRLRIELKRRDGNGRVFAEVFEEIPPRNEPWYRLVHSISTDNRTYEFEASTDGPHVLRLQPELGASNEWEITIRAEGGLRFPVAAGTSESIGSEFGAPRDGGNRDHQGVDIFAPRGTSVVAVADGEITSVKTGGLGGKVVWQRDEKRGVLYYYAHLDQQLVTTGQRVRAGDPIGTVGNTGNARGTPPHLHFGVYRGANRAIDPERFLLSSVVAPPDPVYVNGSSLGRWLTMRRGEVSVRAAPRNDAPVIHEIARDDRVLVIGAAPSDWHRVRLEDGRSGFVPGSYLY